MKMQAYLGGEDVENYETNETLTDYDKQISEGFYKPTLILSRTDRGNWAISTTETNTELLKAALSEFLTQHEATNE